MSKLTVDLDHYAHLHNLWIWVFNLPTYYYLPVHAVYPAKPERTSGRPARLHVLRRARGGVPGGALLPGPGRHRRRHHHAHLFQQRGHPVGRGRALEPRAHPPGRVQRRADPPAHRRPVPLPLNAKELWQREDGWQFTADINRASDTLLDSDYGNGVARLGNNSFDSATFLGKNFAWGNLNVTAGQQVTYFLPNDPFYSSSFPASMQKEPAQLPGHGLSHPPGLVLPGRRRAAGHWATTWT